MPENPNKTMAAEDLAIELMTSRRSLPNGRAEARRLLEELRTQWARDARNLQMTAHETGRPSYHMGQPCRPDHECHVRMVIEAADPDAEREKGRNDRGRFL